MKVRHLLIATAVVAGCGSSNPSSPIDAPLTADGDARGADADVFAPDGELPDGSVPLLEPDAGPDVTGACAQRPPDTDGGFPVRYWFAPATLTVPAGHTLQLVLCDPSGEVRMLGPWSVTSSAPEIVKVEPQPWLSVFAQKPGRAAVTALLLGEIGFSAQATITVTDTDLVDLELTPTIPTLSVYGAAAVQAIGHFPDGSARALTAYTTFTFADGAVAAMGYTTGFVGPDGFLTYVGALAPGKTELTAAFGGATKKAAVTVTAPPAPLAPTVSPASFTGRAGGASPLFPSLLLHPTAGVAVSIEGPLPWTPAPAGLLVASQQSFTCALAGDGTLSLPLFDRTLSLPVHCLGEGAATALKIAPPDPVILQVGDAVSLSATATFPGGLDDQVPAGWSSSDPSVAALGITPETAHVVTGKKRGSSQITARYGSLTATVTVAVTTP